MAHNDTTTELNTFSPKSVDKTYTPKPALPWGTSQPKAPPPPTDQNPPPPPPSNDD